MLMASTFLPLMFINLPPVIGSHHLWTIIWVLSLLVFNPKIFLNKAIVYLLIYGLLLYLATETIWSSMDDWDRIRLFFEFYEISIGITVITYFFQNKDFIGLAKITRWAIIFLFITAIMSIITSAVYPLYARNLTALSEVANAREIVASYNHYGGGTYSTAGAFMCLFPVFIYYYKNINISLISKKQIIVFSIIVFLALLGMQIFGNIIIAIVFSVVAMFGMKKVRRSILVIMLFFAVTMAIPKGIYIGGLRTVSNYFEEDSQTNYKLRDLAVFIETGANINDNSTGAGSRAGRYPLLFNTFIKSPLLGCYFFSDKSGREDNYEGGHLYWMNKLTVTGIIGLIFFLWIPFKFIKENLRYFNSSYKFYYSIASLSILCYGLIKVIGGRETWYAFFIILPGLYYLPLLKKGKDLQRGI